MWEEEDCVSEGEDRGVEKGREIVWEKWNGEGRGEKGRVDKTREGKGVA